MALVDEVRERDPYRTGSSRWEMSPARHSRAGRRRWMPPGVQIATPRSTRAPAQPTMVAMLLRQCSPGLLRRYPLAPSEDVALDASSRRQSGAGPYRFVSFMRRCSSSPRPRSYRPIWQLAAHGRWDGRPRPGYSAALSVVSGCALSWRQDPIVAGGHRVARWSSGRSA